MAVLGLSHRALITSFFPGHVLRDRFEFTMFAGQPHKPWPSWRLPEHSWTCDTQWEFLPGDWRVRCLRNRAARRSPSIFAQRKDGRHASIPWGIPVQDLRWTIWKDLISHWLLQGDLWPPLLCTILCPVPMEHVGLCVVSFSEESFCLPFQCGDRVSPSLLIISFLLTLLPTFTCPWHLSRFSLITISGEVTRKGYQKTVLCFWLFCADSFRELNEPPL